MPSFGTDPAAVRHLISQGESQTVEFKTSLPDVRALQRIVAAFANSDGGILVIGIDDWGRLVGVTNPAAVKDRIDRIIESRFPDTNITSEISKVDGKAVVILAVPKGSTPYTAEHGLIPIRMGVAIEAITRDQLTRLLEDRAHAESNAQEQLRRLNDLVVELNDQLTAAAKWSNKIRDMIVGGIIGAILGYGLSVLSKLLFGL